MKQDYTTYNALDFVQDESFIEWVRRPTESLNAQWQQFLADHPEKQTEIEEARTLIERLQVREEDPDPAKIQAMWDNIDQATAEEHVARRVSLKWMAYAAAAALGLFLVFQFLGGGTTIQTHYAEQQIHTLPDGSSVTLNAQSEISYREEDWSEKRIIQLEGEAFFEVKKGAPFRVQTKQGTVEVLGTSFNVFDREERLLVTCYSGKVSVKNQLGQEETLTPGKSVRFVAGEKQMEETTLDLPAEPAWKSGIFTFKNTPLDVVFDEVERQFDVEIKTTDRIQKRNATVFFEKGNLDSALYKITWPMGLTYEKRNGEIVITE